MEEGVGALHAARTFDAQHQAIAFVELHALATGMFVESLHRRPARRAVVCVLSQIQRRNIAARIEEMELVDAHGSPLA